MSYPIRVGANALIVRDGALLLVEFDDQSGLHYNLPGGGIEAGESVKEGLRREVLEETCTRVQVGELAFVVEYEPKRNQQWAGSVHKLGLIFACILEPDALPKLPKTPDPYQTGVRWLPIEDLSSIELLPRLGKRLRSYLAKPRGAVFLEEPIAPERSKRYLKP